MAMHSTETTTAELLRLIEQRDPTRLSTMRESHREQIISKLKTQMTRSPLDRRAHEIALERISDRLENGDWEGSGLRPLRRKVRQAVSPRGDEPVIEHDRPELLIVRALALTWPAAQFSVTPKRRIFAGYLSGYHRGTERLYVSGLSPILDDATDLLYERSAGSGGRLYIRDGYVEAAKDRGLLAQLAVVA